MEKHIRIHDAENVLFINYAPFCYFARENKHDDNFTIIIHAICLCELNRNRLGAVDTATAPRT